mmetsp:Transcript_74878/g.178098  ORF Transcript_74878/g.178098 Transcript_74878/m.178098 type:complete len:256 (+) Transcript_74878:2443-3210(+)
MEQLLGTRSFIHLKLDEHSQQCLEKTKRAVIFELIKQLRNDKSKQLRLVLIVALLVDALRKVGQVHRLLLHDPHQLFKVVQVLPDSLWSVQPAFQPRCANGIAQIENSQVPYVLYLNLALLLAQVPLDLILLLMLLVRLVPELEHVLHELPVGLVHLKLQVVQLRRFVVLGLSMKLPLQFIPVVFVLSQIVIVIVELALLCNCLIILWPPLVLNLLRAIGSQLPRHVVVSLPIHCSDKLQLHSIHCILIAINLDA